MKKLLLLLLSLPPGAAGYAQTAPTAATLTALMQRAGMDDADFWDTETWAAALLLSNAVRDSDTANGVDRDLLDDGKPVEALESFAGQFARFDALDGPFEVGAEEIAAGAAAAPKAVRSAIAAAARHIARVARAQLPRSLRVAVAPGVTPKQAATLQDVAHNTVKGKTPAPKRLTVPSR